MKVFVYKKTPASERQMTINDVVKVEEDLRNSRLIVTSSSVGEIILDTRYVKTSIYQN